MEQKKQYKVLRPIGYGGRRERGEVIDLSDEQAASLPPDAIQLLSTVAEPPKEVALEERPLETLKVTELRELASKLGLKTDGSKADLVERINLSRA